jgi:hypothetical protein
VTCIKSNSKVVPILQVSLDLWHVSKYILSKGFENIG